MFPRAATLSFEHLARALEAGGTPCLQVLRAPAGVRSFLVSALEKRLARPVLLLAPTVAEAEETFREVASYLGAESCALFPSVELSPYEEMPPYAPAVHDRMRALHRLAQGEASVVVAPVEAALEKTLPREVFLGAARRISAGMEIDVASFSRHLSEIGYARLPSTADTGDFSVRGGIVEIFSPAHPLPARLSLDGDRIESLRWFDPKTQRTRREGGELVVLPCSQVITRPDHLSAAAAVADSGVREALGQGIRYHGIEAILPLLYGRAESMFEYLPARTVIAAIDAAECLSR